MENDFKFNKIIWYEENSFVYLGEDNTCIKKVDLPKCFIRLKNEAQCLSIMDGNIAPKLISYNEQEHELRMEYIKGLTLIEYVKRYNLIPKWFFAKLVLNLFELLDCGIEYGADMKYGEHFIIEDGTNNLRIIDYGISHILQERQDIIKRWKNNYRRDYAFVFNESKCDEYSKNNIIDKLLMLGIKQEIIDNYFNDYETI